MKRFSLIYGVIFALILAGCTIPDTDSGDGIVQTEYGALQGSVNDGIYTFLGVPYAEAHKRFVPAEKVKPWEWCA